MSDKSQISITITDQTGTASKWAKELIHILQQSGISVMNQSELRSVSPPVPLLELAITTERLQLQRLDLPGTGPIYADFTSKAFKYRIRHGGGRKQALGRAIGLKPHYAPLVFDATAGLGRDGFILATLGCRVVLCERSAITHSLLADALRRATEDPDYADIIDRVQLIAGNSSEILPTFTRQQIPDVIYLDPMFPHRTKSALVKKEMRILRSVAGDDPDSHHLLKTALVHANNRVVCKRPAKVPALDGPSPSFAIKTKKHRFDVYLTGKAGE